MLHFQDEIEHASLFLSSNINLLPSHSGDISPSISKYFEEHSARFAKYSIFRKTLTTNMQDLSLLVYFKEAAYTQATHSQFLAQEKGITYAPFYFNFP